MTVYTLSVRMAELVKMVLMIIPVPVMMGFMDVIVRVTLMSVAHHLVGMVDRVPMVLLNIIANANQDSQVCFPCSLVFLSVMASLLKWSIRACVCCHDNQLVWKIVIPYLLVYKSNSCISGPPIFKT